MGRKAVDPVCCVMHVKEPRTLIYEEQHCMGGHENCVLPPSDKYKQGLIATGGNDHKINVYKLDSPSPEFTLTGHTDTGGCGQTC